MPFRIQETIIGGRENMDSNEFKERVALYKPGYPRKSGEDPGCPRYISINQKQTVLNRDLAELRTSLLAANILGVQKTETALTKYIKQINKTIWGPDYEIVMEEYAVVVDGLDMNVANADNPYPVAQVGRNIHADATSVTGFLSIYSLMKRGWIQIQGKNKWAYVSNQCQADRDQAMRILTVSIVIDLIQQKEYFSIAAAKGPRLNLKDTQPVSNQIGITVIQSKYLNDRFGGKSLSWKHPGRVQCRVPYHGTFGERLKDYRRNNSPFGSVQCGISGSVNFCLFMYLGSLACSKTPSRNPALDVKSLLIATSTMLVADGGHNIRETVTGLTLAAITLHIWLTDLKKEFAEAGMMTEMANPLTIMQAPKGKLCQLFWTECRNFCVPHVCSMITPLDIFRLLIMAFKVGETFIVKFYKVTGKLNPLGVFASDLNRANRKILKHQDKYIAWAKNVMYMTWFGSRPLDIQYSTDAYNAIMILTALDNKRYDLPEDSFKTGPSLLISNALKNYPGGPDVLDATLRQLTVIMKERCNIKQRPASIPLAFGQNRAVRR